MPMPPAPGEKGSTLREIRRATDAQKRKMNECIAALNEHEPGGFWEGWMYELHRAGNSYTVWAWDSNKIGKNPTTDDLVSGRVTVGGMYVCTKCWSVREYFEGQVTDCLGTCLDDTVLITEHDTIRLGDAINSIAQRLSTVPR